MTVPSRPLEFRKLRRSDVPGYLRVVMFGVGRLERSTGLDRGTDATLRTLAKPSAWAILGLLRAVGRPILDIFVAVDDSRVVGTGTILWLPACGYVAGMATEPEHRGQGIASRIMALQQAEVARRHKDWLALDVEGENETALRVYRKAGYREVARFSWFSRPGLPDAPPSPSAVRPATRAELAEVVPVLDAARSAEYRAALPASRRMLSHIQILVSGRRVEHRVWVHRTVGGDPMAVRAVHDPNTRLGAYFVLPGRALASAEEVERSLAPATEWLRTLGPTSSFAVVPEPVGEFGPVLERLGFAFAVRSLTMVRPAAGGGATPSRESPGN